MDLICLSFLLVLVAAVFGFLLVCDGLGSRQ